MEIRETMPFYNLLIIKFLFTNYELTIYKGVWFH